MIEFKGKITGNTLKFHSQRYRKLFVFSSIITTIFMLLILGGSYLYRDIVLVVDALSLPFLFLICPSGIWGILAPSRIYINFSDQTIRSERRGCPETYRMIDDVVEVRDHGEFYSFKFNSIRNQYNFIAQKDLITQGTIEEFENLFEEVMVRVHK